MTLDSMLGGETAGYSAVLKGSGFTRDAITSSEGHIRCLQRTSLRFEAMCLASSPAWERMWAMAGAPLEGECREQLAGDRGVEDK